MPSSYFTQKMMIGIEERETHLLGCLVSRVHKHNEEELAGRK